MKIVSAARNFSKAVASRSAMVLAKAVSALRTCSVHSALVWANTPADSISKAQTNFMSEFYRAWNNRLVNCVLIRHEAVVCSAAVGGRAGRAGAVLRGCVDQAVPRRWVEQFDPPHRRPDRHAERLAPKVDTLRLRHPRRPLLCDFRSVMAAERIL